MTPFDAGAILRATTSLRALEYVIRFSEDKDNKNKNSPIVEKSLGRLISDIDNLLTSIQGLDTNVTAVSAREFKDLLVDTKRRVTYANAADYIQDIGVTLRRELSLMSVFMVERNRIGLFNFDQSTLGGVFASSFPSAVFEFDEAGKCLALGRSTASVFHLMRVMEIGIRAVARCLNIGDPVKGYEKNWGYVLREIKKEMDTRNGLQPLPWKNDDKAFFDDVYASLDAVRVAWRNTTMHVQNKYVDDEAEHIFIAVKGFVRKLASRCDETGTPRA
jgi:hypothetical protein